MTRAERIEATLRLLLANMRTLSDAALHYHNLFANQIRVAEEALRDDPWEEVNHAEPEQL